MTEVRPSLLELLKADAPGSCTFDEVPIPMPIAEALREIELVRNEVRDREIRVASVGRLRSELGEFFDFLKGRFLDGRNLISLVLLRRIVLFTSFVAIWSTPILCETIFSRWLSWKTQPELAVFNWDYKLIAISIYVACVNVHIAHDFAVYEKSFLRVAYGISAFANIGYAVCYFFACIMLV